MKVSNCCGAIESPHWLDAGVCPWCREGCEYVTEDQDDKETMRACVQGGGDCDNAGWGSSKPYGVVVAALPDASVEGAPLAPVGVACHRGVGGNGTQESALRRLARRKIRRVLRLYPTVKMAHDLAHLYYVKKSVAMDELAMIQKGAL